MRCGAIYVNDMEYDYSPTRTLCVVGGMDVERDRELKLKYVIQISGQREINI